MVNSHPSLLLFLFAAINGPLHGAQRDVVSGFVRADVSQPGDFLFSRASDREPVMGLKPSTSSENPNDATRVTLEIEYDNSPASGRMNGQILRRAPDEVLWPSGLHLSPNRFAGQKNAMNPGFNVFAPFEVIAPADFDGDGVPDESDAFPADRDETADNDGDGIGDKADPDDDNDSMPDDYETQNGLDPLTANSASDADGDSRTNFEEYVAGTDPRDGTSFFRIDSVTFPSPGQVELTWQGLPGRDYGIWRSDLRPQTSELLLSGISVSSPEAIRRTVASSSLSDFFFLHVKLQP